MGEILNPADIGSPEDLEGARLKLEEISRLELNPTERVTDQFAVAKNRAFFESQYGNIVVYTLDSNEKIAEFHFEPNSIREITTDSERVYLELMGYTEAKEDDVLIAALENRFDNRSALEFIGKRIKDMDDLPVRTSSLVRASNTGQVIVSFPVSTALTEAIIDNPYELARQSTRFLIPENHGFTVDMFSKDGYVECGFAPFAGPGCHGTFYLKDGELYVPEEEVLEKTRQGLPEKVLITAVNRLDLRAQYLWNPENPPPKPMPPLQIVFRGGREHKPLPQAYILRE
ncbi:hypothetical protein GF371_00055, partial [Candidatus Woesearchaeota archaeon]|nr:hypothetical protein [Candidatus Woesearchaeota archaeon]